MSKLTIRLLGATEINVDQDPIDVDTTKAIALGAYLAVTGKVHRRDELVALLWAEADQSHGRGALRRTLSALRKAVGKEWIEATRDTIGLSERSELFVDVVEFRRLVAGCPLTNEQPAQDNCDACISYLTEAVALYQGDFMAGFSLRDTINFDDWQFFEAEELRRELGRALKSLIRCHTIRQEYETAIDYARRWLALDHLHEPAQQTLMRLFAWAKQHPAALRQYRQYADLLDRELGTKPTSETQRLYETIKSRQLKEPPGLITTPVAAEFQVMAGSLKNLPLPATTFVGRSEELLQIEQLLDHENCRLLTLVGPGGIGKTRLAAEAARMRHKKYRHGVHFIPLASLSSVDFLPAAIGDALGFTFYSREEMDQQVVDYLREKELLLILDNFEHLLEGSTLLKAIMLQAPGVQLFLTSQQRIGLQGEWLLVMQGLPVPESLQAADAADYAAVRLFTKRAHHFRPDFHLDADTLAAVVHICKLVGGMPLAIELAASWVRLLSCTEIVGEIERSIDFLTTTMRDVPQRHRNLRAIFDNAWKRLEPEEQQAFQKLSVFQSGFQRQAAAYVAEVNLPTLLALADKSLLIRTSTGRYNIPEVLRTYAYHRLGTAPKVENEINQRHSKYYANYLHQREPHLVTERQVEALAELSTEIDNVRRAWHRAIEQGQYSLIQQAFTALYLFYERRSWFREGKEAFGRLIDQLSQPPDSEEERLLLVQALARQGRFCSRLHRYRAAKKLLERGQVLVQTINASNELAYILSNLGIVNEMQGNYDEARRLQEESLTLYRQNNHQRGVANSLIRLGNTAMIVGKYEYAEANYRESLDVCREHGFIRGQALCLNNLGAVAEKQGEYKKALALHRQSLEIKQTIGDRRGIGFSLNNIGFIMTLENEAETARPQLQQSLEVFREIGDRRGQAYALHNLGSVANCLDSLEDAAQLYEDSRQLFASIGDRVGQALALNNLGLTALAMNAVDEAWQTFKKGLTFAMEMQAVPVALDILFGMSKVWIAKDRREEAAAILIFVNENNVTTRETAEQARVLLSELTGLLEKTKRSELEEWVQAADLEQMTTWIETIQNKSQTANNN